MRATTFPVTCSDCGGSLPPAFGAPSTRPCPTPATCQQKSGIPKMGTTENKMGIPPAEDKMTGLGLPVWGLLASGGYTSNTAVIHATDAELLAVAGIGRAILAQIREVFPHGTH